MAEQTLLESRIEDKVSILFKTLSDPTRIKIIYALKNKELTVSEIVELVGITQSAVSHQLRVLRNVNLVNYVKKGKEVIYSLSDEHVYNIFDQAVEHVKEEYHYE
ncbi:ArsR/SmtB family transcription factor [Acholeplasma laidlawii]|uniref:ArsR/SmtB family transcription factor n=1 Tax=Acholeplasma laidlawii TaxID=2148 RepID=UPI0021F796BB|nr:metalloregulator ArsR/SmtB family transcription factor [Acholeplasma laidlawii]WIF89043.1 metalloregulator ArsR/SmtB family transcription factor [Acholeplasma laidlawii]